VTFLNRTHCVRAAEDFYLELSSVSSEVYSHFHEELQLCLNEAERFGYGFAIPKTVDVVPNVPRLSGR